MRFPLGGHSRTRYNLCSVAGNILQGRTELLQWFVETINVFPSAFTLLLKCIARLDGSPKACVRFEPGHKSNKHSSREGAEQVHPHSAFLYLFTKHWFSGSLHRSWHFIAVMEQNEINLIHLCTLVQNTYSSCKVAFLLRHPEICLVALACSCLQLALVLFRGAENMLLSKLMFSGISLCCSLKPGFQKVN